MEYQFFFRYMQMEKKTFFFRPNLIERLHDAE
jgi:hypothetical protein